MIKVKLLIASTILALAAASASHGQTIVDMSKFTCAQLLEGTEDSLATAIWFSGYYNGYYKNIKLNLAQVSRRAGMVVDECRADPKKTVMQTVEKLLSGK